MRKETDSSYWHYNLNTDLEWLQKDYFLFMPTNLAAIGKDL